MKSLLLLAAACSRFYAMPTLDEPPYEKADLLHVPDWMETLNVEEVLPELDYASNAMNAEPLPPFSSHPTRSISSFLTGLRHKEPPAASAWVPMPQAEPTEEQRRSLQTSLNWQNYVHQQHQHQLKQEEQLKEQLRQQQLELQQRQHQREFEQQWLQKTAMPTAMKTVVTTGAPGFLPSFSNSFDSVYEHFKKIDPIVEERLQSVTSRSSSATESSLAPGQTALLESSSTAGPHGSFSAASNEFDRALGHSLAKEHASRQEEGEAAVQMFTMLKPRKRKSARKLFVDSDEDEEVDPSALPFPVTRPRRAVRPKYAAADYVDPETEDEEEQVEKEKKEEDNGKTGRNSVGVRYSDGKAREVQIQAEYAKFRELFELDDTASRLRILCIIVDRLITKKQLQKLTERLNMLSESYLAANTKKQQQRAETALVNESFLVLDSIYHVSQGSRNRLLLLQKAFKDLK